MTMRSSSSASTVPSLLPRKVLTKPADHMADNFAEVASRYTKHLGNLACSGPSLGIKRQVDQGSQSIIDMFGELHTPKRIFIMSMSNANAKYSALTTHPMYLI